MAERPLPSSSNNQNKPQYSKATGSGADDTEAEQTPVSNMPRLVTTPGTVRKPTLGSKFKQAFTGDDAQSVGNYLFFDVIVPGTKNILFDLLSEGARRVLFGSGGSGSSFSQSSGSRYANRPRYAQVYSGGNSQQRETQQPRQISSQARSTHNFQEIVFPTRAEAENVRDGLLEYISEFGAVTVADFYNASGITAQHTDTKHGWDNLTQSNIRNVRDGYLVELPPTIVID